jgi:hypothetical protein
VSLKDGLSCKAFGSKSGRLLNIAMDTNWDEEVDYTGAFTCKKKADGLVYGFAVTKAGDEDPSTRFKVVKVAGKALTVSVPASILEDPDNGSLDLYVSSTTDSDECTEDTTCADRAPDLGWVRSL